MHENIILSVKPAWAEKIMSGEKTIELRRRFIKRDPPVTALLYASSPAQELVGIVTIVSILRLPPDELWHKVFVSSCVTERQYRAYFDGADEAAALMLDTPVRFETPLPLADLRSSYGFSPPMSWRRAKLAELELVKGRR